MRGARSFMSETCGGAAGARLRAKLLGDEAEHARALVLVEALALMPPAVEFEFPYHEPIISSGGGGHYTEAAANLRSSVTSSAFNERATQR